MFNAPASCSGGPASSLGCDCLTEVCCFLHFLQADAKRLLANVLSLSLISFPIKYSIMLYCLDY